MRKHLCTASASLAVLVSVSWAALTPASAENDAASRAVRYIESQQGSDGSVPGGFSTYQPGEDFALGAAAAGYDPNQLKNGSGTDVVSWLKANAPAATGGSTPDAGGTGRLLEVAVAARASTTNFGGVNLVARLNSTYGAQASGAYGDGQAFTQALAILGLVAAGQPVPAAALSYIHSAQDSDGGWDYLDIRNDPSGSDTNSTAMLLMALDAAGDHALDASALAFLRTQQLAGGGYPYQNTSTYGPPASDPDSTALVVQALLAAGIPLTRCDLNRSGATPLTYLYAQQQAAGGFVGYTGSADPGTTSEAIAALAVRAFPVAAVPVTGISPAREQAASLAALQYIETQEHADGSVPGGFSTYQPAEDSALGTAAAGYDPNQLKNGSGTDVVSWLKANASAATGGSTPDAGGTGRLLEVAVAARASTSNFGGIDLVARLNSTYAGATGAYGDGQAFTQALAVLGLEAAGQSVPAAALSYIHSAQDSDGGWDYLDLRGDPSGSDTNSTAMLLMALDGAGDHSLDATALAYLRTQQLADGGFPYQNTSTYGPPASDPDSTALVVQALGAAFSEPGTVVSGGHTPIDYLLAQQQAGGGYTGYSGSPDAGTTSQVPAALERVFFPVRPAYTAGTGLAAPAPGPVPADTLPAQACTPVPGPSPSPSPSPSVSPSPAPSATPSPAASPTPSPSAAPTLVPAATPAPGDAGSGTAGAPLAPPSPTPSPSASVSPSPSPSPSPTRSPVPSPSASPSPGAPPVGEPGGAPPALVYLMVAAGALVLVVGAGGAWFWLRR